MGESEPEDLEESRLNDFVKRWNWLYVVFQMAELFRETREEQYRKPVKEFLNDMAFMRDKHRYDIELEEERLKIISGK